ncbi:hypothetical protein [Nodularia spumigena]|jgi:hypothetical protein|uniref:hypothetical protein n=1 Tax=Nodularia spumigena TaxID=70799 RepID=UPI002330B650|nr:hypothetical protein [Nodularia spumigena]MDB9498561.1 hypothetical protein [Nodularia spumigena CS-336/02]
MNRLETLNNGGFPLTLNDFRYADAAVRQALYGVFSAYSDLLPGNGFIISGCTWVTATAGQSYTAGFIFIAGEIVQCDGGVFPTRPVGESYIWDVVEIADPAGVKVFRNQASNNTYFERRAVIISALVPPPPSTSYLPLNAPRLAKKMYDSINSLALFANKQQESWSIVGVTVPYDAGFSNMVGGRGLQFRKDDFGVVTIRGDVAASVVSSPTTSIFTLPVGYRPTNKEVRTIAFYDNLSGAHYEPMELQITTNGRVFPARTAGNTPSTSNNWFTQFEITFNTN